MIVTKTSERPALKMLAARAHHVVGWSGWIGLALLVISVAILVSGTRLMRGGDLPPPASAAVEHPGHSPLLAGATLSSEQDLGLPLTRIERAALSQGLGWTQADYRLIPATDDAFAVLEVRCTIKGAYPDVRQFITAVLQDVPGSTLREFGVIRTSTDSPAVEAHLAFAVFLRSTARDEWAGAPQ